MCVSVDVCESMSRPVKVIFTICLGFVRGRGQLGTTVWTTRILMMTSRHPHTTTKKVFIGDLIKCQDCCCHTVNIECVKRREGKNGRWMWINKNKCVCWKGINVIVLMSVHCCGEMKRWEWVDIPVHVYSTQEGPKRDPEHWMYCSLEQHILFKWSITKRKHVPSGCYIIYLK